MVPFPTYLLVNSLCCLLDFLGLPDGLQVTNPTRICLFSVWLRSEERGCD